MVTRYVYLLRFILAISDTILVNFCLFFSYQIVNKFFTSIEPGIYQEHILTCNILWLICTGVFRLYSGEIIYKLEYIYRASWRTLTLHFFLFVGYLFFSNSVSFPKELLLTFYILLSTGFVLSRFTGTAIQELLSKHFEIRKMVAVLGRNPGGIKLASYFEKQSNLNFIGFLGDDGYHVDMNGELLPGATEQLKRAARAGVKEVFVSLAPERLDGIPQLLRESEKYCVRLKFVPDLSSSHANFKIDHMGGFPVLCARNEPLEDIHNRFKKRLLDIIVASFAVVLVLSWLYPILAMLIKIQSPGPVLFKQLRTGRDNKPFYCYKFRSMSMNMYSDKAQASKNDVRITPIGRFIRRTSIDELPQFINVLLGNMSVVGPRPHMLSHTKQYSAIIDKYMVRQFLKPGISGWAQVKGYRGETKDPSLMEARVEHDIWYMNNWSAMLDVRIIFMTAINAIKGEENAY